MKYLALVERKSWGRKSMCLQSDLQVIVRRDHFAAKGINCITAHSNILGKIYHYRQLLGQNVIPELEFGRKPILANGAIGVLMTTNDHGFGLVSHVKGDTSNRTTSLITMFYLDLLVTQ